MERPPHLEAGREAEDRACALLRRRGLKLVTRNFRCRSGEIDLIMRDADTLVFVEVRLRRNPHFGAGADTVGTRKQARLIAAAQTYLQRSASTAPCRFDVVSVSANGLDWIPDAFRC